MAKKYRYILCGVVEPDEPVSNFRLIAPSTVTRQYRCSQEWNTHAIRVDVTGMELEKWSCDPYSTTDCDTPVKDLNPEVYIRLNGKWQPFKKLTDKWSKGEIQPHEFYRFLEDECGFNSRTEGFFTDDKMEEYEEACENKRKKCEAFLDEFLKEKYKSKEDIEYNKSHRIAWLSSFPLSRYAESEWGLLATREVDDKIKNQKDMDKFFKDLKKA